MPWRVLRATDRSLEGLNDDFEDWFVQIVEHWQHHGAAEKALLIFFENQREWHGENIAKQEAFVRQVFRLGFLPSYWGPVKARSAVSNDTRSLIIKNFDHVCGYCGRSSPSMHLDHIVPTSRGGEHSLQNLALACNICNSSKNDRIVWEWYQP